MTRYARACRRHGLVLEVAGDELRCPAGHRLPTMASPSGLRTEGEWAVVDRRTGEVLALASTDAIILGPELAQVVDELRAREAPAWRPRLPRAA